MANPSTNVIRNVAELRALYREPSQLVQGKKVSRVDDVTGRFLAGSPFVLLATADADGNCDVSPRGGPPGFVRVLDEHRIAIPDLSGNNLLDSIGNIVHGSGIGLLFLIPGMDETLRVNGQACLTTDPAVLDACAVKDRRPKAAIGVTVVEQFMHCAKAFRRSELWNADVWPDRASLPTLGCILKDQIPEVGDIDATALDASLEEGYAKTLWEVGGRRD